MEVCLNKASSKYFKCKCKMILLEISGRLGFHASALLSAHPTLIWLCPLSPLLLNIIQTVRCTTQGGPQLLTALCGRPHHASQSWVAACLCFRAIALRSWLHLNRGKSSVRKNKWSMSLSLPLPNVPLRCTDAAQPLRLPGNHHWLGRTTSCGCGWASPCVCVVANAMHVSLCVSRG